MSMKMNTIDEDIIEEILLRLPVQSLVRYKSVCKKWLDLIESSAFIKSHLKLSSKRDDRILFKYFDIVELKNIVSCYDNYESMASPPPPPRALDFDLSEFSEYSQFMNFASCTHSNGIVCLSDYSDFNPIILFNPALREFKIVPPCPLRCPDPVICSNCCTVVAHGFGFDAAINNFKVVRMMFRKDGYKSDFFQRYYMEAQIYDLSTNCWRRSGRIHINIAPRITPPPVFFNGILHYICWRITKQQSSIRFILTFNISTELFEIMEFPSHWEDCYVQEKNMEPSIFMADESTLALVAFTNPFQIYSLIPQITCVQFDVWIMKEYGVRESWTKHYSLMSPDYIFGMPLSFSKKHKLLFITTDGKLICYDLPTRQQRQLRQYRLRPNNRFEDLLLSLGVVICNESLVSMKNL